MTKINIQAFPFVSGETSEEHNGMTLMDYFAAISLPYFLEKHGIDAMSEIPHISEAVADAYIAASEMTKIRKDFIDF